MEIILRLTLITTVITVAALNHRHTKNEQDKVSTCAGALGWSGAIQGALSQFLSSNLRISPTLASHKGSNKNSPKTPKRPIWFATCSNIQETVNKSSKNCFFPNKQTTQIIVELGHSVSGEQNTTSNS